jgi:predicted nucleic acid-binding protein
MGTDDFLARVGYETCLRSYAAAHRLPPDLEELVNEPDWEHLDEVTKDHWREIVRAMRMAGQCRS